MRIGIYSIRDKLMGVFLPPFHARHDVEAVRQVQASLSDPQMAKAGLVTKPSDFDLVCLGHFDDEVGELQSEGVKLVSPIAALKEPFNDLRTVTSLM